MGQVAHLKCDVSGDVYSKNLNILALKINVTKLISCAKGTDYVLWAWQSHGIPVAVMTR